LGQKKRGNVICRVITFSPRTFKSFSPPSHLKPIMQFSQFGVAFEVMHAFTLDGQINYAKSCKSLCRSPSFLILLPLVTSRPIVNSSLLYLAIVAPGILPRAPVKSTPVRAWIAGGRVPINLFTSCVVLLPPPISTIWSVLARGAETSAAI